MTVTAAAVTVGTAAVPLHTAAPASGAQAVSVLNTGTADVYLGGPDVTTTAGWPLKPGASMAADLASGEVLHGIGAAAGGSVRVLQAGA